MHARGLWRGILQAPLPQPLVGRWLSPAANGCKPAAQFSGTVPISASAAFR